MVESQEETARKSADVIDEIQIERIRQIEELGYDAKHDDDWSGGEVALAAACYAAPEAIFCLVEQPGCYSFTDPWPWDPDCDSRPSVGAYFIPTLIPRSVEENRRLLIKAAALIVAEIQRLDRAVADTEGDE